MLLISLFNASHVESELAGGDEYFQFDKVFGEGASQEVVFTDVAELVTSAVDGYRVCVFAYGQTGSGKTHTLSGDASNTDGRGLIPRSLHLMFQVGTERASFGWTFTFQISVLEVYNEQIVDLLKTYRGEVESRTARPVARVNGKRILQVQGIKQKTYKIVPTLDGTTEVVGLRVVEAKTVEEAMEVWLHAQEARSTGSTAMNDKSSRSHCVLIVKVQGTKEGTNEQTIGVLNLVDLAGSERLKKSKATDKSQKETICINKSLSALSLVLTKRARNELPDYRSGKLTQLLQSSIEKNSKTLMILNVSPALSSSNETHNSLKFGVAVNKCELGAPSRNVRSAGQ